MENKQSRLLELYHHQNKCSDSDYLFSTILFHAAPVLHSDKSAVLLTFATNHRNLKAIWDQNRQNFPYGVKLKFYEISKSDSHTCVLFYDESSLTEKIMVPEVLDFLTSEGYENRERLIDILATLRKHSTGCCPHEVGIFLGYPLEDVLGFIANGGKNCLTCGYWKVYADPEAKQILFNTYDDSRMQVIKDLVHNKVSPDTLL